MAIEIHTEDESLYSEKNGTTLKEQGERWRFIEKCKKKYFGSKSISRKGKGIECFDESMNVNNQEANLDTKEGSEETRKGNCESQASGSLRHR